MSGRFLQIAFAIGYLAMLCLALCLFSGCSTQPAPMSVPSEPASEPVKIKVELGESKGSQLNATVTKSGRQLQTTVTTSEYGTKEVTLKFRPGEEEASERETRYTSFNYGHELTIEKLNWNGEPRELKTWVSKDNASEPTLLYRHAIFTLDGKIQWQEFYNVDGSVRQRSKRTKDGGLDSLCIDDKKQAYLLREDKDGKLFERFDYPYEGGPVREYNKWSKQEEHLQLEWRRWYDDGTLEVEMTLDDQGYTHTKWYRRNGVLKFVVKGFHHKDRDMDSWEEYYEADGKTVWRKTEYVHRVRTTYSIENGIVEVVSRYDCRTGDSTYTLMHPRGHKLREVEWKMVPYTTWDNKQSTMPRLLRAEKMDENGRLAVRYNFDVSAKTGCPCEALFYREGVLVERQIIAADKTVTRIETIAADGKVASAVDVDENERKPFEADETVTDYISERSHSVEEILPDRLTEGFKRN